MLLVRDEMLANFPSTCTLPHGEHAGLPYLSYEFQGGTKFAHMVDWKRVGTFLVKRDGTVWHLKWRGHGKVWTPYGGKDLFS